MPEVLWRVRQQQRSNNLDQLLCISTYLSRLGYKLFTYGAGSWSLMGMKQFLQKKGYTVRDITEHQCKDDDELFELLHHDVLPQLADKSQWPFVLLVLNVDTHSPYTISGKCDDYLAKEDYPQIYREFNCMDQRLRRIVEWIKELNLDKSSEVLISGDYISMGNWEGIIPTPRQLAVFLPFRPQNRVWKVAQNTRKLSYYDFAPTILDLLEVDYSPDFVFGKSMFGQKSGSVPSRNDLVFLYEVAIGADPRNATCHDRAGLCEGNET
jgi:phosphoglycerol transferase MdoB-like AlkP superfamily enzyme